MEVYQRIANAGNGHEYGYVYTFGAYQIVRMKIDVAGERSFDDRVTDETFYDLRDVEACIERLVADEREREDTGKS